MMIQQGKPLTDGKYIAYVEGSKGKLEPWLTNFADGAWRYRHSTAIFDGEIHGWIGPLPELTKRTKLDPIVGVENMPPRARYVRDDKPEFDL